MRSITDRLERIGMLLERRVDRLKHASWLVATGEYRKLKASCRRWEPIEQELCERLDFERYMEQQVGEANILADEALGAVDAVLRH